jgi:hypothetical protein
MHQQLEEALMFVSNALNVFVGHDVHVGGKPPVMYITAISNELSFSQTLSFMN